MLGCPGFARSRKLRGAVESQTWAGVNAVLAVTEKVMPTVAFSPRTFLIGMDLAVRKAGGH